MKQSEIAQMTTEELNDRLVEEQANQTKQEMTHTVSPLENPLSLRANRRLIARIKTELRRREIEG
ncbi:MAG: 50S ribosomal protein L29 [Bacteroidota bacterium]|nr:50S ribosomal protein L29 [Bacteroidota bacterium]MDX5505706.1 50S ribosomal protein L29 [Bacteroidota bacterium]